MANKVKNQIKKLKREGVPFVGGVPVGPGGIPAGPGGMPQGPTIHVDRLLKTIGDKQMRLEMAQEEIYKLSALLKNKSDAHQAAQKEIEKLKGQLKEIRKKKAAEKKEPKPDKVKPGKTAEAEKKEPKQTEKGTGK